MAPSANLHLDRGYPSMFEPVHGSALDIAGRGIANPIGAVLSAAMMVEELGSDTVASVIRDGVARACARKILTPDLGGSGSSADVEEAIIDAIREQLSASVEVRR
jgi:tartrate dehydrogenase/decarboxylase/D-malate dehydrogenase